MGPRPGPGPSEADEAAWRAVGRDAEALPAAEIERRLRADLQLPPTWGAAVRACPAPAPAQAQIIEVLRVGLREAWQMATRTYLKGTAEDLRAAEALAAAQEQKTRDTVAATLMTVSAAVASIPYVGGIIAAILQLAAVLAKVARGARPAAGPDTTEDSMGREAYRGFGSSFAVRTKNLDPAAFRARVDMTLSAYSAALGIDLFCAFPAKSEQPIPEARLRQAFQQVGIGSQLTRDRMRQWLLEPWDFDRAQYLLESLPEPGTQAFNELIDNARKTLAVLQGVPVESLPPPVTYTPGALPPAAQPAAPGAGPPGAPALAPPPVPPPGGGALAVMVGGAALVAAVLGVALALGRRRTKG